MRFHTEHTVLLAAGASQSGPNSTSLTAGGQSHRRSPDGFVSVNAPYAGGELITHPLRFEGSELVLNAATSAAGGMYVELQDASGRPLPGYSLSDSVEWYGDEIEHVAAWKKGSDVSALAGKPVRVRFALKDADLYSIRFR